MRILNKLLRNQDGNVLLMGALAAPLLLGAAGMAIDAIQLALKRTQLQRSADSASLACAYAVAQGKAASPSATRALGLNNPAALAISSTVENAPSTGPYFGDARAVRVVLSAAPPTPFMSFFTHATTLLRVEATASAVVAGQFCVISLEDGTSTGVSFSGNADVDLGCGVASNSRASQAIAAGGSASVSATPLLAVGGVPASSRYVGETTILPFSPPQADPYAGLPVPSVPSGCSGSLDVGPQDEVSPALPVGGVLCFRGMNIKGRLDLPDGAVVIVDGSTGGGIDIGAKATISGRNVTIILTSALAATDPASIPGIDMNGGATLDLTPPASGTYAGILVYQDPRAVSGATNQVSGNSFSTLEGAFYFPRQDIEFIGNSGLKTNCVLLVARRIAFTGSSRIDNQCPPASGTHAIDGTLVRLVA